MTTSWQSYGTLRRFTHTRRKRATGKYINFMVYMKRGIFRFAMSILHSRKEEGVWDLINMTAKSRALFLYRMRTQGLRSETIRAEWMRFCGLTLHSKNPPLRDRILAMIEYVRRYVIEAAYVVPQGSSESQSSYMRRRYDTLHNIIRLESGIQDTRITRLWPQTAWKAVWKNLGEALVSGTNRAA